MSNAIKIAIEELQKTLEIKFKEVSDLKKTINMLCIQSGAPIIYQEVDTEHANRKSVKPDEFAGKDTTLAIEHFLRIKDTSATIEEIHEALNKGGFEFSKSDPAVQKRNIAISLANPKFHSLQNGTYGLKEKYGISFEKKKYKKNLDKNSQPSKKEDDILS